MNVLTLPAPAKLNLMLHIIGRRADGYHDLQTLFQFLDYGDELRFERRTDGVIRLLTDLPGVLPEQNLIVRAARLLQRQAEASWGVDIYLTKRLPMGGGIGGGSSDAATTLLGLNHLWGLGWPPERLSSLGLTLGADVPIFISGHAAFAEGVGERLTPVELPEPWYLVVRPQVSISTAEIFSAPELTRDSPTITVRTVLERGGRNDCQPVVEKRYPEVADALRLLSEFSSAKLTGTGSCVFAAFNDESQASHAAKALPESLPSFVAKGSNVSMLHKALKNLSSK